MEHRDLLQTKLQLQVLYAFSDAGRTSWDYKQLKPAELANKLQVSALDIETTLVCLEKRGLIAGDLNERWLSPGGKKALMALQRDHEFLELSFEDALALINCLNIIHDAVQDPSNWLGDFTDSNYKRRQRQMRDVTLEWVQEVLARVSLSS